MALTIPAGFNTLIADARSLAALAQNPTGVVQRVVVRTKYLPDIVAEMPLAPGQPGPQKQPDFLVRMMQPRVDIVLAQPLSPITIMPAGDPGATQWSTVKWVGIAAAAVLGFVFIRGLV